MKPYLRILPLIAIFGVMLLVGCEGDEATGPTEPTTAPGWINQGWSQYRSGSYGSASESFQRAINMADADYENAYADYLYAIEIGDPDLQADAEARMALQLDYIVEGATGTGWAFTKEGDPAIGTLAFDAVIDIDPDYADALAGYAFLLQTIEQWQQSNTRAGSLLEVDSTWVFEQDRNIDHFDLRLIRAENYYFLADFEASLQEALELTDLLGYQPEELLGVSVFNQNLATIEGRTHLIELIEELDLLI